MSDSTNYNYTAPDGRVYTYGGNDATCTIDVCPVELSVYGYRASLPLSAILIALYGVCAVSQVFLGWRYKTWGFMAAVVSGCIVEILGYVGRILMWQNPWNNSGFIMQIVLITIGPVFFSAAIYVMLTQIIEYVSVSASRFPPKLFYWVFIPCDIISLVLQAVGGALSSTSNGSSQIGVDIALAGLGFQVATLFFFVAFALDYAVRARQYASQSLTLRFKMFVVFLTLATLFIWIRCCYRVYELSEGYSRDSEALRDQSLFIGLEAIMVILAAFCLIAAHPGFVFGGKLAKSLEDAKLQDIEEKA